MTFTTLVPNTSAHAVDPFPPNTLDAVSLQELNDLAALQTRVDRKYLVFAHELVDLFQVDDLNARVLEVDGRRQFGYTSTYFDTPSVDCYLNAARSRPNRFKVRTRTYLDSDIHYLEIKTRARGRKTKKTRHRATLEDHANVTPANQRLIAETLDAEFRGRTMLDCEATVAALQSTLTTHYSRTTLLVGPQTLGAGAAGEPSRATIDTSLAFSAPGTQLRSHPDLAIIETKTAGAPSPIDRLLWRSGHRPTKISKFGAGLALFRPDLPATKWNRALRRYFAWRPLR